MMIIQAHLPGPTLNEAKKKFIVSLVAAKKLTTILNTIPIDSHMMNMVTALTLTLAQSCLAIQKWTLAQFGL